MGVSGHEAGIQLHCIAARVAEIPNGIEAGRGIPVVEDIAIHVRIGSRLGYGCMPFNGHIARGIRAGKSLACSIERYGYIATYPISSPVYRDIGTVRKAIRASKRASSRIGNIARIPDDALCRAVLRGG